jgi:hypothetical protein
MVAVAAQKFYSRLVVPGTVAQRPRGQQAIKHHVDSQQQHLCHMTVVVLDIIRVPYFIPS